MAPCTTPSSPLERSSTSAIRLSMAWSHTPGCRRRSSARTSPERRRRRFTHRARRSTSDRSTSAPTPVPTSTCRSTGSPTGMTSLPSHSSVWPGFPACSSTGGDRPRSTTAAEALVNAGVACVGIDSLNIDGTSDGARPVHTTLLDAEIPIIEHLTNLAAMPAVGFRFTAVPPKFEGAGTFTVRAFATLD